MMYPYVVVQSQIWFCFYYCILQKSTYMVRVIMFSNRGVLQDLNQLPILLWNYKPKDNYNMEEMGLLYIGSPIRKAFAQGKMREKKVEKHNWD